jgi:hypothetical protein
MVIIFDLYTCIPPTLFHLYYITTYFTSHSLIDAIGSSGPHYLPSRECRCHLQQMISPPLSIFSSLSFKHVQSHTRPTIDPIKAIWWRIGSIKPGVNELKQVKGRRLQQQIAISTGDHRHQRQVGIRCSNYDTLAWLVGSLPLSSRVWVDRAGWTVRRHRRGTPSPGWRTPTTWR